MCGINGILRLSTDAPPVDREELLQTREAMACRGPDGCGVWISPSGLLGLGHRRLAIIDLSDAGLQPMPREGGRYQIVFNGEIYNHRELRAEFAARGESFQTQSDTEVILALYAREGVRMLSRLRGMFALALWDEQERRLLLARDPYGIKPLYFAPTPGQLRFASQVKALAAGGAVPLDLDPAGLVGFLLWGSVPEPLTLHRAVRSLPAGHYMLVEDGRVGVAEPYPVTVPEAGASAGDVVAALEDSVRAHLVSDVPVGIFLSAGLDSSLLAALSRRCLPQPPTTLTLRFDTLLGTASDEGPLAAETARALGTRHVERLVSRREFLDIWPRAVAAMDQPSIDGFNTFVISQIAHESGFKVVLSGLGGDELLGGYTSFREVPSWRRSAAALASVPGLRSVWPALTGVMRPDKPKLRGFLDHGGSLAGAYFLRRGLFLPSELPGLIGADMAREGLDGHDPLTHAERALQAGRVQSANGGASDDWLAVHALESSLYMRNQLLRDCDWASMAHSLELRVPLVDPWLRARLEAAGFEPARSRGKAALVKLAAPELPAALWERPKSGFRIPVMEWIDADLDPNSNLGRSSRRLALRILEYSGVEISGSAARAV